jgi:Rrf2 family protein
MKLSTRMRYGTRVMVDLGAVYEKPLSARELARSQHLPVKYLEHIMASLKGAGLIKPLRGGHGGYSLARGPKSITLLDLYRAFEGTLSLLDCLEDPKTCEMSKDCPTRDTWGEMNEALRNILKRTTIQDLVEKKRSLRNAEVPMYHI